MELNLACHTLNYTVEFIIHYDQLFNWDDIYLYLVTANKILSNYLKSMLGLNHFLW
jgi:hypothetical protein